MEADWSSSMDGKREPTSVALLTDYSQATAVAAWLTFVCHQYSGT